MKGMVTETSVLDPEEGMFSYVNDGDNKVL